MCKNPVEGIGKPEPLNFDLQGYWSRRINQEHRIIYAFDENQVTHAVPISLQVIALASLWACCYM
ncbi:MAG: Txe/YoeB family addiction module toxin [Methylococcales bacterium]|nr:Txe/YoeB family addiction module toxin [Methylococcales bacterium]